jgi:hypothetical protein
MDYSKTKIYKIYSHLGNKIYIGSTTNDYLSNRMAKHRTGYTFWKKHNKQFLTSYILFEEYGIENCIIELIEAKECINKEEKNRLEGGYIRTIDCINKNIMGLTKKESNKKYFNNNKEIILKKQKEYNEDHKEQIYKTNKDYRDKNNDIIKEQKNQYYKINKDKINEKRKEKIICICGCNIRKDHIHIHQKSLKHQQFLGKPSTH